MIWLTWRQFRLQALTALGLLTAIAAAFAFTGGNLAHLYDTSGLGSCAAGDQCATAMDAFFRGVKADSAYPVLYFAGIGLLYLGTAVVGMFWGAPLVTKELEAGTFRLSWTQSVTRVRWLALKLGVGAVAAMTVAGLLGWVLTWWTGPIDRADGLPGSQDQGLPNHFNQLIFGARGVVPIGYAAFAFVLGVTLGVLVRKTVPAMAATLAVFIVVQAGVPTLVREHYATPAHTSQVLVVKDGEHNLQFTDTGVSAPFDIPGAWVTSVRYVDTAGRDYHGPLPASCGPGTEADCFAAINQLHLRQEADYQPASRFWRFQWTELGLYLAMSLALAGFCTWRIRHLRLN